MILVHPPVSKPGEPPAGGAKLLSFLRHHRVKSQILDTNLEGLLHLLHGQENFPDISTDAPSDTWTKRARRNLPLNLTAVKSPAIYRYFARYKKIVNDLNRLLKMAAISQGVRLSLANYQHLRLSPTRSSDLIQAAENPEQNPFYPYFAKRFELALDEAQSRVVGFSLNYLSQALSTLAMIGFLKRHYPGIKIILGGGLITSWMSRPDWQNPFGGLVDFLVAGPGENQLLSILQIKEGDKEELCGCQSPPDYGSLPMEDYLSPGFILPYSSASGCYWNRCLFCPERAEGNPHNPIPVDRVVGDLKFLVEKTRPVLIHFLDNAIRPALMERIIASPPGVPWYGFARITRHLADLDFCTALKKSGCVMLQLGIESGDQGVLDQLQKGIKLEMASLALKNLARAGVASYVYLLLGTPAENEAEAKRTLEFTAKHSDQISFLNLALFNLPVGSQESKRLPTEKFYEGDLSLYVNFSHPRGWNRNLVRQFLEKEFKRHPAIAPILRRDPPFFTSNHAPFFQGDGSWE